GRSVVASMAWRRRRWPAVDDSRVGAAAAMGVAHRARRRDSARLRVQLPRGGVGLRRDLHALAAHDADVIERRDSAVVAEQAREVRLIANPMASDTSERALPLAII